MEKSFTHCTIGVMSSLKLKFQLQRTHIKVSVAKDTQKLLN